MSKSVKLDSYFLITWSTTVILKAVVQEKISIAALFILGLMKVASLIV